MTRRPPGRRPPKRSPAGADKARRFSGRQTSGVGAVIYRLGAILATAACLGLMSCGYSVGSVGGLHGPSTPGPTPVPGRAAVRPNIVFVLTDDLSINLLRFMPHVRALERQGARFANYFVADSLCCPSRASIFTGKLPHNTGVLTNSGAYGGFRVFYRRGEERHTFASALQRAGYLTAMMGKYLNGYLPGGDRRADGTTVRIKPGYVPPGWNQWDVAGWGYNEFNYQLNESGDLGWFGHSPDDYLTDVLARKGVRFINAAARRHRPFFLELSTFAPHHPYTPAPRNARDFPSLTAPRLPSFNNLPNHPVSWLQRRRPLSRRQIQKINHAFRQRVRAIEAVDRMIGQVEDALRANEVSADTYVVFSSDNGLHMGEYRLTPGKGTAFDTDIHVPLIVIGPGVRAGAVLPQLAENIDLAETFAAIGKTPLRGDGRSLLPILHGQRQPRWRSVLLIEHHPSVGAPAIDPDFQPPTSGSPGAYHAIRASNFLYVDYADGEVEFYDLRRDPFELHNIARSLSGRQLLQLHRELNGLRYCRGAAGCRDAMHVPPLRGRW